MTRKNEQLSLFERNAPKVERNALDRMKTEAASEVLGYGAAKEGRSGQYDDNSSRNMAAKGEAVAEALGTATISNEYNCS